MVNFACKRCGKKAFSNANDRDEHEAACQVQPRFICGECDYRTASKCNFRRHLERISHHRHPTSADPDSLGRGVSPYTLASPTKSSQRLLSRLIKNSPRSAKATSFSTGKTPSARKRRPTHLSTDVSCQKRLHQACSLLSSQQKSELPSTSKKGHLDSEQGSGMELDALCGALNERMVTLPRLLPASSESFSSVISEVCPDPEELEYSTSVVIKEEPADELTESMSSSRAPHPPSGASTLQKQPVPPPKIRRSTASNGRPSDNAVVVMSSPIVDELRTMMWDVCRQFSVQLVQNKADAAGSPGDEEADETNIVSDDPDLSSTDNSISRTGGEDVRAGADSITTGRHSTTTNGGPSTRKDSCVIGESKQREIVNPDGQLTPEDEFLYGVGSLDEIRTSVERRPDGSWEWVTTVYRTWSKRARRLFPQPAGQRVLMSQTRRTMTSSVDRDPLDVLRCIDEEYLDPSAFQGDS